MVTFRQSLAARVTGHGRLIYQHGSIGEIGPNDVDKEIGNWTALTANRNWRRYAVGIVVRYL